MKNSLKLAIALALALPAAGLAMAGDAQARDGYGNSEWRDRDRDRGENRDRHSRRDQQRGLTSLDIHGRVSYYYYDVAVQDRRGDTYYVSAETPRGQAVRLRVNAYSGEVENVNYLNGGSWRVRPPLNGRRSSANY